MQARAIEKRAAVLGHAGILAAAILASGCAQIIGIEDLPSGFVVRGTAVGVLGPVALELRIDGDTELRTVTQEGTFTFETMVENGDSYTVVFVEQEVPCTLRNQTGVIAGADTSLELTCTAPALASVVLSGIEPPTVTLVPGTTDYVIDLPLLQQSVTLTATVARAGETLAIAGAPVASGTASAELTLSLGDNPVDIVVENAQGWQRIYRLTLRRATVLAQYAYGKASNTSASDQFGFSVALAGDTLAVGAYLEDSAATGVGGDQSDDTAVDSGAVYVFRRVGTIWEQEAYLKASNTNAGDQFGINVALSDDMLAVAAYFEDSAATGVDGDQGDDEATDSGAVYVFRRVGTAWEQEAYLKASNTDAGDNFGSNLALAGDTLAVAAYLEDSAATGVGSDQADDDSATDSGAVYVFRRVNASWAQEAYIKTSNTEIGDYFGSSVALADDTIAVGAAFEDSAAKGVGGDQANDSALNSGAVYIYRREGSQWSQEAYIKASNTASDDYFGSSVALAGDTLAVGAVFEDSAAKGVGGDQANDSAVNSGAVYVFRRIGTSWGQEAYLKASNTGTNDVFGISVALAGDTLAVGARDEDSPAKGIGGDQVDDSAANSGAVYTFLRVGTSWAQAVYLKASNTGVGDRFGHRVTLSGDTLAIGAHFEGSAAQGVGGNQADNGAMDSGAVYIFH